MQLDLKDLLIARALHDCEGGGETVNNQHKVITENGVYIADSGYTGLGTVVVDVAQTGGGGAGKLPQVVDKSVTEITEEDLQGASKIGMYAFAECEDLETITIPESVRSIEYGAFSMCWKLATIRVKGHEPPALADAHAFIDTPNAKIVVDAGHREVYANATNWSESDWRIVEDAPEVGEDNDGVWLFKGEYIDGSRTDLPVPVIGVSYTCFVDGEMVGVSVAGGGANDDGSYYTNIIFRTEDGRVVFKYDDDMRWHFHPVESQVQSGTVSVRING